VIGRQYQGKSFERELPRCASTRYGEVNSSVSDREFAVAQPPRRENSGRAGALLYNAATGEVSSQESRSVRRTP
jgi:hypothetical protein